MTTTNEVNQTTLSGPASIGASHSLPFVLDDDDDLKVFQVIDLTNVSTTMVKGVNYSATTGAMPIIVAITAIPALSTWNIERRQAAHQNTDLVTGDKLPSGSLEDALDKLTRGQVDLRKQDWRSIHTPPEEQPSELTNQMPDKATRANNFFVWDSLGNPAADSTSAPVGSVLFTPNGKSIVNTVYSGMRTLLGILSNKLTKGGSIELGVQPSNGTDPVESQELLASTQRGRALMPDTPSVGLGRAIHEVPPAWRIPWTHPNSEVQGFSMMRDPLDANKLIVGVGVAQPFYQGQNSSTGGRTYSSSGKDLRVDSSLLNEQGITKDATIQWTAGDQGGGLVDEAQIAGSDSYVFVIGRESDDVCDIIISTNFTGDDISSTSNVVVWAGAASNLFIRRIGVMHYVANAPQDIRPFYQIGFWTFFKEVRTMNTTVLSNVNLQFTRTGNASILGNVLGPKETSCVKLTCWWTPVAAGDVLCIRNQFNYLEGDSLSDYETKSQARGIVAGQMQVFQIDMLYDGLFPNLYAITNNAANSSLKVYQHAYYDPRGNSPRLAS